MTAPTEITVGLMASRLRWGSGRGLHALQVAETLAKLPVARKPWDEITDAVASLLDSGVVTRAYTVNLGKVWTLASLRDDPRFAAAEQAGMITVHRGGESITVVREAFVFPT